MHGMHRAFKQNAVASRYGLPRNATGGGKNSGCSLEAFSQSRRALPGCVTWEDAALLGRADVFCRALGKDKSWKVTANVSPSSLQGDQMSWRYNISYGCLIKNLFLLHPLSCPSLEQQIHNKTQPKMKSSCAATKSNAWAEPGVMPFSLICS